MTTAVIVSSPKPNHNFVEVVVRHPSDPHSEKPYSRTIIFDGESTLAYVHDGAEIVIREVSKVKTETAQ